MDTIKEAFIERFNPSNPNISYLDYLLSQNLEGRRQVFKWFRTKSRFQTAYTDEYKAFQVMETARKFSEISNVLIMVFKSKVNFIEYNQLVELIIEDDEEYYIQNFITTGISSFPKYLNKDKIMNKLKSMGYKVGV